MRSQPSRMNYVVVVNGARPRDLARIIAEAHANAVRSTRNYKKAAKTTHDQHHEREGVDGRPGAAGKVAT